MSNFVGRQNEIRSQNEAKKPSVTPRTTIKSVICHKHFTGGIFVTVFAITVPLLFYYFIAHVSVKNREDYRTCSVKSSYRVPCGNSSITFKQCRDIECCYDSNDDVCYHYMPSKYAYEFNEKTNQYEAARSKTPYNMASLPLMSIHVEELAPNKILITLNETNTNTSALVKETKSEEYTTVISDSKLMIEILRDTGDMVFTSAYGALIASENYWEWSFFLSENFTFGLGQTLINHNISETITKVVYNNKDSKGIEPTFLGYVGGKFTSVTLKHEGPLEVTVLPSNLVIVKSVTGNNIEIEINFGPTPKDIHDEMIGDTNVVPPEWVLGSHVCRKGSATDLSEILKDYEHNDYVSDCIHENLFMALQRNPESLDDLKSLIYILKDVGKKIWLAMPPHVVVDEDNLLYIEAQRLNVLYNKNESEIYKGKYLNLNVTYPDFLHSNINDFFAVIEEMLENTIGLANIDGFLLVSNWPQDDSYVLSDNSSFSYFSEYLSDALSHTIPWNLTNSNGVKHIEDHNMYASYQLEAISAYFKSKNPDLVIESSSSIFGQNEPLILENVDASWDNLRDTLNTVLFSSITGNHLVSVPICGDTSTYDPKIHETLCIRWYSIALTMPVFRMYSEKPFREITNLNSDFAVNSVQRFISVRNKLQNYYYTILKKNEPVIRPLFYDFYEENATLSVERAYMIGDTILVAHPLTSGQTVIPVYFPYSISTWYEFYGGKVYKSEKNKSWFNINNIETDSLMFVAQGSIIPLIDGTNMELIVALDCDPSPCEAKGSILFQDNLLVFNATQTDVTISNIAAGCSLILSEIKVYTYNYEERLLLSKDVNICSGSDVFTVPYVDPTTVSTTEETTTVS